MYCIFLLIYPSRDILDCFSIFAIVNNKYLYERGKVLISLRDSDFFFKFLFSVFTVFATHLVLHAIRAFPNTHHLVPPTSHSLPLQDPQVVSHSTPGLTCAFCDDDFLEILHKYIKESTWGMPEKLCVCGSVHEVVK